MDKAIDFLKRELSDLERLMKALENAMERKQSSSETETQPAPKQEKTSTFHHDTAHSLWVD